MARWRKKSGILFLLLSSFLWACAQSTPSTIEVEPTGRPLERFSILYDGPKPPKSKEGNWQVTVPGKGYFAVLRLYGPTEAALDKSWKPGDFEKVK
jgi:hypothetical protein